MTALSGLVALTFDLLTLDLVRNVTRGTGQPSGLVGLFVTFLCRVIGKHASN